MSDVLFIAILGVLLLTALSVKLLNDGGIGWHIRTGQIILSSHSIPRVDPFSSTMQGKPWFAWEWLYDVIVGELERVAGLNGVVCFNAVVIAAVFAGAFRVLRWRGTGMWLALGLVLLSACAAMVHFLARPHVVSWLLVVLWFWILDGTERGGDDGSKACRERMVWILPVLMLVWVNLHGGFLIGFVLLGSYLIDVGWRWISGRADEFTASLEKISAARRTRTLVSVGTASVLATLVNPYGWKLHAHIYRYLTNRFLMDHIEEFQSPNFHGIAQKCFALLLILTIIALGLCARKMRIGELLVVIFAIYSGLYAARNIPVSSLLLAFVIGPVLREAIRGLGAPIFRSSFLPESARAHRNFFTRMQIIDCRAQGMLWSAIVAIATFIVALNGGKIGGRLWMDAHFDAQRFPVAAVNYMDAAHVAGPVLGPDYWGGYFIYRLYPAMRVALDDRHDLYGAEELKLYLKFLHAEPGWEEFMEKTHPACLVLPSSSAMANVIQLSGGWKRVYEDKTAIVYVPQ